MKEKKTHSASSFAAASARFTANYSSVCWVNYLKGKEKSLRIFLSWFVSWMSFWNVCVSTEFLKLQHFKDNFVISGEEVENYLVPTIVGGADWADREALITKALDILFTSCQLPAYSLNSTVTFETFKHFHSLFFPLSFPPHYSHPRLNLSSLVFPFMAHSCNYSTVKLNFRWNVWAWIFSREIYWGVWSQNSSYHLTGVSVVERGWQKKLRVLVNFELHDSRIRIRWNSSSRSKESPNFIALSMIPYEKLTFEMREGLCLLRKPPWLYFTHRLVGGNFHLLSSHFHLHFENSISIQNVQHFSLKLCQVQSFPSMRIKCGWWYHMWQKASLRLN